MTTQSVQVKLELGHRASFRAKPTAQGFTHDWTVFVRCPGNEEGIHYFVDKVVFQLHESFHKARRVITKFPFEVTEVGYAGFLMPIEVHFKNKEEPKKVIFQYDLFLHLEGQPPVNHVRCEKLTFKNPTEDFRRKLIRAGGVGVLEEGSSPSYNADKPAALSTYKPDSSSASMQYKIKQETEEKYSSTAGKPPKPIKTESQDIKPAWKEHKAASKGPKSASKEPKSASKEPKSASKEPKSASKDSKSTSKESKSGSKEPKSASKEPKSSSKESKSTSKETKSAYKDLKSTSSKEPKSNSKVAQKPSSGKRPPSSSPPPSSGSTSSQDGTKKRKKSSSAKDKSSSSSKSSNSKSSDKQSSSGEKSKSKSKSSKSKASAIKQQSKLDLFKPEIVVDRRKSKSDKKEPPPKILPSFEDELSTGEIDDDDADVPSPSSSISFSSLPRGGGKGALNTLMHEIDGNDDDDEDIVTPFQSDPFSNHHNTVSNNSLDRNYEDEHSSRASSVEREKAKPEKVKEKEKKSKEKGNNSSKKNSSSNGQKKSSKSERKSRNSESGGAGHKTKSQSQSHDSLAELVLLHRKLMSLRNREQIQRIVDLIGDTDHFQISDNSFDFDLCSLDKTTVKKLQDCIAPL